MNLTKPILLAALLSPLMGARAEIAGHASQVGEAYEITRTRETSQQSNTGSSGSSHDVDTIVERVVGQRPDGLELEYDLPKSATAEDRASNWQMPARVFRPSHGPMQLLNRAELEARVDAWLKSAGWPRAICGHWIFTWNGFRIECDPQSVIKTIESFDLRSPELREGAPFQDSSARAPGRLTRTVKGSGSLVFVADMPIDPEAVRHARAETDVAIGEITKKPVTLDAALIERSKENVSGTISIRFDADPAGNIRKRTTVTNLKIEGPNGRSETQSVTETLERTLLRRGR